ncbi:hypothetical protein [Opitutus terrae]|uniref:Uncharacterized protein n=1 Tax=Opitutus terrae (strain DSM 11246 / JCM 15787 / PB90-1) TaxID=452637 RepID=B1ZPY6_OPITP|nr:hypothetical protein [Opitutus terrae]ACB77707.1 hypothetical protein Oter_4436 [Opitutus terrae PB90-1]
MKTKSIRLILMALAFGAVASNALAGPGPQYWQSLRRSSEFKKLKAKDKVIYVCNQCQTVSEMSIDGPEGAMALCKEGSRVSCPMCKKETKVVMKRQRNDPPTHTEVTYVNEKGEECAFVAKTPNGK